MKKINKNNEPFELTQWKNGNPQGQYKDLTPYERCIIRQACATEQLEFG